MRSRFLYVILEPVEQPPVDLRPAMGRDRDPRKGHQHGLGPLLICVPLLGNPHHNSMFTFHVNGVRDRRASQDNRKWNFWTAFRRIKPSGAKGKERAVSRTNFDKKPIRRVLSWLVNRDLTDADLAEALDMPTTTFSRRKDEETFPSYEEICVFARHFELDQRALQVSFGYLDIDGLILLDEQGMQEYLEQGGGNHPHPTMPVVRSRISQLLSHEHWDVSYGGDDNSHSL